MQTYQTILGAIAGVLALAAFIPYINSIIKGETKPNRATFAIWSGVGAVTTSSYIASGARTTIFIGLVYTFLQFVIFIMSFKYGMGGFNYLDVACLVGAITGAVLWIITKNAHTALYLGILCEVLGFIPTLNKSYFHPQTENTLSWTIGAIAAVLNLFALTSLRPEIAAYPFYDAVGNVAVACLLLLPKITERRPML